MFLLRAQFYFFYLPENKVIALSALTRSEDREPAFVCNFELHEIARHQAYSDPYHYLSLEFQDEMFALYFFRRLHEETFAMHGSNRDVIAYIGASSSHNFIKVNNLQFKSFFSDFAGFLNRIQQVHCRCQEVGRSRCQSATELLGYSLAV
jgi:hypothetical protein